MYNISICIYTYKYIYVCTYIYGICISTSVTLSLFKTQNIYWTKTWTKCCRPRTLQIANEKEAFYCQRAAVGEGKCMTKHYTGWRLAGAARFISFSRLNCLFNIMIVYISPIFCSSVFLFAFVFAWTSACWRSL